MSKCQSFNIFTKVNCPKNFALKTMLYISPPDMSFTGMSHLISIALGGFTTESVMVGGRFCEKLTYHRNHDSFWAFRIEEMANYITSDIIIFPKNQGAFSDGQSLGFGGMVYQHPWYISVEYDISDCLNAGYWIRGADGSRIDLPAFLILAHELSHAYHLAVGNPLLAGEEEDETLAITETNIARSYFGLPLRSTTNHEAGCGTGHEWADWWHFILGYQVLQPW